MTKNLLRSPGQSLRDKIEDKRVDIGVDSMLLLLAPSAVLAALQIHALISSTHASFTMVAAVMLPALAFVAWQTRKLVGASAELDKLRLGFDGEVAVGQELDQLMRDGAVVFHDMPAERFNIDHVVIARQGVFAVETKGYTKPNLDRGAQDATVVYDGLTLTLPDRSGTWAIEQAQRQARWLATWLTGATGEPIHVTPVLAMPGWYVKQHGEGNVAVLSGGQLRDQLLRSGNRRGLSAEQVRRVAHQIERECRNVLPSYRPDEPEPR